MQTTLLKDLDKIGKAPEYRFLLAHLTDKLEGRCNQKELEEACLRWSFHYALNDLRKRKLPVASRRVANILNYDRERKRTIFSENKELQGEVMRFMGQHTSTIYQNKESIKWLKKMKRFFTSKDEMNKVGKIQEVIDEAEAT